MMQGLASNIVLALAATVLLLQGCADTGSGSLIAEDRRSNGTYVDDQGIELKAGNRISEKFADAHVNVTSFNHVALLTGEVPNATVKVDVGRIVEGVAGVRVVQNELVIGPASSTTAQSADSYITSKVKTRFIEQAKFQVNHVKVVTEAGIVYLMGLVTRKEAADAAQIAATTNGVTRVVQVFEYTD
jgi:osmotically-inducible protein OsmY